MLHRLPALRRWRHETPRTSTPLLPLGYQQQAKRPLRGPLRVDTVTHVEQVGCVLQVIVDVAFQHDTLVLQEQGPLGVKFDGIHPYSPTRSFA